MWVKLDDRFPGHPKVKRAGPGPTWLYVAGLCYCASYLTDGFIPSEEVQTLTSIGEPQAAAEKLVEVNLWERGVDGFQVHDYLDYNPSKAEHLERLRKDRERKKKTSKKNPPGIPEESPSGIQEESEGAGTGRDWTGRDGFGPERRANGNEGTQRWNAGKGEWEWGNPKEPLPTPEQVEAWVDGGEMAQ